jgi:mannose-6-phosphate isomerase-like protein (cupin superfamily)
VRKVQILGSDSGAKMSIIFEVELTVNESLSFDKYAEEKIYYFLYGRGIMSIYDEGDLGDTYVIRPDTAVWITTKLGHSVKNKGKVPLRFIVIDAFGKDGENPVRLGHKVTRVYDEHSNPSRKEGLHLEIRPNPIGQSNRFLGAEVNIIAPLKSSRPHVHDDTEENNYVIVGDGVFHVNEEKVHCSSGSTQSYPLGATRRLENLGTHPLNYINYVTYA